MNTNEIVSTIEELVVRVQILENRVSAMQSADKTVETE